MELTDLNIDRYHDRIVDLYDESLSKEQLTKLVKLARENGNGLEFIDAISNHFVGMNVPMFGDSEKYKTKFRQKIEDSKKAFLHYIEV